MHNNSSFSSYVQCHQQKSDQQSWWITDNLSSSLCKKKKKNWKKPLLHDQICLMQIDEGHAAGKQPQITGINPLQAQISQALRSSRRKMGVAKFMWREILSFPLSLSHPEDDIQIHDSLPWRENSPGSQRITPPNVRHKGEGGGVRVCRAGGVVGDTHEAAALDI